MKKINRMKKILFLLLWILATPGFIYAQTADSTRTVDKSTCDKWVSLAHEFVKAKHYDEALPYWEKLHENCPGHHKAIYIDGIKIFKHYVETEKDSAKRHQYAEQLIRLHDEWKKYFPQDETTAKRKKAIYMVKYEVGSPDEVYALTDELFRNNPERFDHPLLYLGLFKSLVDKYKKGEITQEELFRRYDEMTELADRTIEKYTKRMEELQNKQKEGSLTPKEKRTLVRLEKNLVAMNKVYRMMDEELGELGNCDVLVKMYSKNFDEHKEDPQWLRRAAKRLKEKECQR